MSQAPTPDSSSKGLPPWLSFLFLVIGPPAAFVTLIRAVTQNPVLIILLVVGYEVLLFVLRFTAKIWQPLEEQLAKHITQWLTVRTQEMTSRYYRCYCQYMVSEHQQGVRHSFFLLIKTEKLECIFEHKSGLLVSVLISTIGNCLTP